MFILFIGRTVTLPRKKIRCIFWEEEKHWIYCTYAINSYSAPVKLRFVWFLKIHICIIKQTSTKSRSLFYGADSDSADEKGTVYLLRRGKNPEFAFANLRFESHNKKDFRRSLKMGRTVGFEPTYIGTTIRGLNRLAMPAICLYFIINISFFQYRKFFVLLCPFLQW